MRRGHLYRRGRVWWCWYYRAGRQVRVSTRCTDRAAAESFLSRVEREAQDPSDRPADSTTIGTALDRLIAGTHFASAGTEHMYKVKALHLDRILGEIQLRRLAIDDVDRYIHVRTGETAARETIRKELGVLRALLKRERKRLSADPRDLVPEYRVRYEPRRTTLTPEQADRLLAELPPGRREWAALVLLTGLRRGEADRVRAEDVEGAWLRVRGTKTARSSRRVPLSETAARLLTPPPAPWPNAVRDLAGACARAKVPRVTPNDLRRTYASWLVRAGVQLKAIADLLGHASTAMVERVYGHLTDRERAGAADRLPTLRCDTGVPDEPDEAGNGRRNGRAALP